MQEQVHRTQPGRVVDDLPTGEETLADPPRLVGVELGVLLDALYQPFWIEGPLKIEQTSSELAEAGYQMEAEKIYAYELPDS